MIYFSWFFFKFRDFSWFFRMFYDFWDFLRFFGIPQNLRNPRDSLELYSIMHDFLNPKKSRSSGFQEYVLAINFFIVITKNPEPLPTYLFFLISWIFGIFWDFLRFLGIIQSHAWFSTFYRWGYSICWGSCTSDGFIKSINRSRRSRHCHRLDLNFMPGSFFWSKMNLNYARLWDTRPLGVRTLRFWIGS